jgi:peptidoglycan hydrolase-like protein with peptidoglycan-binding domain
MGVELTEAQKAIPVSESSFAGSDAKKDSTGTADGQPKRSVFRATKDQVAEAQKMLKSKSMYNGEETGKLDEATREGLRKYQEANGLKVTGTLNQATLDKMGIALTDKQKSDTSGQK